MIRIASAPSFSTALAAVAGFSDDAVQFSPLGGRLAIQAASDSRAIRCTVADSEAESSFRILPVDAVKIFSSLGPGPVAIDLDSTHAIVTQAGARFRVATTTHPCPKFRGMAISPSVTLLSADLVSALSDVLPVATTDDTTHSVAFEATPSTLTLISYDGSQLTARTIPATCDPVPPPSVVPIAFLRLLPSLIKSDPVRLGFDDASIHVRSGPFVVAGRIPSRRFVPWRDLPRDPSPYTITAPAAPLIAAIRQAVALRSPESAAVRLECGSGRLMLTCRPGERGSAEISLPCPDATAPFSVALPSAHFLRALAPLSKQSATIRLSTQFLTEISGDNYLSKICPIVES